MPYQIAYTIIIATICLVVRSFYVNLDRNDGWGVNLLAASLGGIPIGGLVSLAPLLIGCLILGPIQ